MVGMAAKTRGATDTSVLVLTFHSISNEAGPTSIPTEIFRRQMDALADAGYSVLTIDDFIDWKRDPNPAPARRALITFDDGFADFATQAFPVLEARGFSSLMFIPTEKVGGAEAWNGANSPARALMTWAQIEALAKRGVEFGSHSLTHADLPNLGPTERRDEIHRSGAILAERLGVPTKSFAAPYGHVSPDVLADIDAAYEVAFGVRFNRARQGDSIIDVPRIEMHYFRDPRRWRQFLNGDDVYFQARRALRGLKARAPRFLKAAAGYE